MGVMAIAYSSAGAGNGTETNAASLDLVCPATITAGDILIAHVMHTGTATAPTTPDGWTELYAAGAIGSTAATARHWVYGKIAIGDEDGTTVGFGTNGGTEGRAGRIYRFTGRVSGTIAQCVPSASFSSIAHDTDPQGPTVTTTVAGALAIALMCQDDNNTEEAIVNMTGGTWGGHIEYTSVTLGPAGLVMYLNTCTPTGDPGTVTGGAMTAANDEAGTIGFQITPIPEREIKVTDGTAPGDTPTLKIPINYITVTDGCAPGDSVTITSATFIPVNYISVTDGAAPGDTPISKIPILYISTSDGTAPGDSILIRTSAFLINVSDGGAPGDSVLATMSAVDLSFTAIDGCAPGDSVTLLIPINYINLSDGGAPGDEVSVGVPIENIRINVAQMLRKGVRIV